jgi:hypothetical protein
VRSEGDIVYWTLAPREVKLTRRFKETQRKKRAVLDELMRRSSQEIASE